MQGRLVRMTPAPRNCTTCTRAQTGATINGSGLHPLPEGLVVHTEFGGDA
ncbi:hypothetical protein ACIBL8_47530 [Streptomyces sp. NPDC050523]